MVHKSRSKSAEMAVAEIVSEDFFDRPSWTYKLDHLKPRIKLYTCNVKDHNDVEDVFINVFTQAAEALDLD